MRVGLRTKLTLSFIGVTMLPLAASLGLLSWLVDREFREELTRTAAEARKGVVSRLDTAAGELSRALERIERDTIVRHLQQDLKWRRFYGDQERERQLVTDAPRLMTAPQLDVLKIVDASREGHVIAMGHRDGVAPADGLAVRVAGEKPGGATLWRREELNLGAETVPFWTLQATHVAGERLVLVGGRVVDAELLSALAAGLGGGAELAAFAPDGGLIATTFSDGKLPPDADRKHERASVEREVGDGTRDHVSVVVYLSRAELHRTLDSLLRFAALLAAMGLLLSLALGVAVSRTITRPLHALVGGAEAIARGELDHQIEATTRDEVGDLVGRFNRMTAELLESQRRLVQAERIAAWKDIARQIAHEVKNPLFPIQTSVETLRRARERDHPRFGEIFEETTRTVLEEVARLSRIVSEFSQFARMPAPRLAPADLNALVHDGASLFAGGAAGVRVEEELQDDLPEILLDPLLMGQVVNNLVKNAVEAVLGQDDGRVVVRTQVGEGVVRLAVEDNGPGVPEDRRAEIFAPYVTHKQGGTGLGLAIVHRIVTEHGGVARVEDAPGGGARFVVELPMEEEES